MRMHKFNFPAMTMGEYFYRLASPEFPNPTGGGAVAVGALAGINLLCMVLELNASRTADAMIIRELQVKSRGLKLLSEGLWRSMTRDISVMEEFLEDEVSGREACQGLFDMLDNIEAALMLIPEVRRLNRLSMVDCDLEAAYWLLTGSGRAVGALLQSNLSGGEDKYEETGDLGIRRFPQLNQDYYQGHHSYYQT